MAFTHLHVHTEYSLLDGSNKIKEYVARVKELGMNSAAITDHGVMYGVIDFYKEAKAQGINPILGCEVYVAPNSRFDRETVHGEDRYYHLVLLAENNTGYSNLMKIVSKGFVDGYYYKPRVDMEVLEQYHEGIIALSACLAGEVPRAITRGNYEEAKEIALKYQKCFGKDNYFLELQDHGIPEQQNVNQHLLRLSQELGIELVATNDIHYTYAEDAEPHDILLCIQTGKKLADEDRMRYEGGQYYVKSEQEMAELFPYARQALENTQKIADRCHVEIEFGVTKLPHFEVPEGYDSWSYLNKLCFDGLKERYPQNHTELEDRLNYELGVIKEMGYVDYFLIVWDFIHYAREHDISVGPGRGSAAGSLVSYTTGITNIDPIKYNLLFERFLNPERVSMPDIDIDFCYERRQEVIDYVVRKYGEDCVTQIVTFGTLAARGVIRDVGRVMDLPYAYVDGIAKQIPMELGITIEKALKMNPELRTMYENDESVKTLIDMSKRLEGLPRHTSMHAAGVVISQKSMDEYVPLSRASDGTITTQFTMTTIEELGLLKMDFLGLRTLTVIQNAVRMAQKSSGKQINIDEIDYQDKGVLELIGSGKTEGIFQLESAGMKNFMKELKPQSLEDIIAGISLYRPGPMDFIPAYIKGKNHPEEVTYDCPQLEPILAPTYGCIVYQEQVIQIFQQLAGYTLGQADMLRRAMSKKKAKDVAKEREAFLHGDPARNIKGCVANGIDPAAAEKIYDEIFAFANYAFNKAHAVSYAVVAYQTAYFKCHFPREYMAALLTSVLDNSDKVSGYIGECRECGIALLPPDINRSADRFTVEEGGIRFGLVAIKNIGRGFIQAVMRERETGGDFTSLYDFCSRMNGSEMNKRAVENLIRSGAFDSMGARRSQLIKVYESVMDSVAAQQRENVEGQMDFFSMAADNDEKSNSVKEIPLPDIPEYTPEELMTMEKATTGLYLSGHPMDHYRDAVRKLHAPTIVSIIEDFSRENGPERFTDGQWITIAGVITSSKTKTTKNNSLMAYVMVEDDTASMELLCFSRVLETCGAYMKENQAVVVKGRLSVRDEKAPQIMCDSIYPLSTVEGGIPEPQPRQEAPGETLFLKFPSIDDPAIRHMKLVFQMFPGKSVVKMVMADTRKVYVTQALLHPALVQEAQETLGHENVVVK